MTVKTPQQVCARAAQILRERGWKQGGDIDVPGTGLDMAVWYAAGDPRGTRPNRYFAAHHFIAAHIGAISLMRWNDAPGRTAEEVLRVLDELAGTPE